MKRIFLIACCIVFCAHLCFADQEAETSRFSPKKISGTVESVTLADSTEESKPEIVVVDNQGQRLALAVRTVTNIFTSFGTLLTLKKVKEGDKVNVEYITDKEGVDKAISIEVQRDE